jgi:hypothetical protein
VRLATESLGGGRRRERPNYDEAVAGSAGEKGRGGARAHLGSGWWPEMGGNDAGDGARRHSADAAAGATTPTKRRRNRGNKQLGEVLRRRVKPLGGLVGVGVARWEKLCGGAPMAAAAVSPGVERPGHARRGSSTSWSNQRVRRGPAGSLGRGQPLAGGRRGRDLVRCGGNAAREGAAPESPRCA